MGVRVLGWYGRGNCGDDAFSHAFQAIFPDLAFRYQRPSAGSITLEPREKLWLGAGDVIKPYYLDCIPAEMEFSVVGAGIGYENEINLLKERKILKAIFRNRSDVMIAREAGMNAFYAPDICFAIDPTAHTSVNFSPISTKKRLGVILSAHATPGVEQSSMQEAAYYEYLQWELAAILDYLSQYYDIYWISFSVDVDAWDEGVGYSIRRKMSKRSNQAFIDYQPNDPLRQLGIVAEMELVITMKFHGAIFATMSGVPFIAIGQTRKLCTFCEEENISELLIPKFSLERERALGAVKAAESAEVSNKLQEIRSRNRSAVTEELRLLFG